MHSIDLSFPLYFYKKAAKIYCADSLYLQYLFYLIFAFSNLFSNNKLSRMELYAES